VLVAWITNHLRNGFFIFPLGKAYEYVMFLTLAAIGLGGTDPGRGRSTTRSGCSTRPAGQGVTIPCIADAALLLAGY
jgi:putative oxidoreductase